VKEYNSSAKGGDVMAAKKKAKPKVKALRLRSGQAKGKAKPKAKKAAKPKVKKEKLLGKVEHVFDKISVAAVRMKAPLSVGDVIHVKGHTTDYEMTVGSMQIEHEVVQKVKKGDDVGIKVTQHTREGDGVYLKN
jgi:hypothetical protein